MSISGMYMCECDVLCVCVSIAFHCISILRGAEEEAVLNKGIKEVGRKYVWEKLDKG